MQWMSFLCPLIALQAGLVTAWGTHVKRGSETNATLLAYGQNSSAYPIAYGLSDGMASGVMYHLAAADRQSRPPVHRPKSGEHSSRPDAHVLGPALHHGRLLDRERHVHERDSRGFPVHPTGKRQLSRRATFCPG